VPNGRPLLFGGKRTKETKKTTFEIVSFLDCRWSPWSVPASKPPSFCGWRQMTANDSF
jgi:hypothetical protein